MTPECQPLDISVNKKFKDNIKHKFEENRLFYEKLNGKVKLQTAGLNLVDFIYNVSYFYNIIKKEDIIKGFAHAGIINNHYFSMEEEKIQEGYIFDLIGKNKLAIVDDLGPELNLAENDLENIDNINDELEEVSNYINSGDKNYDEINGNIKEVQKELIWRII